MTYSTLMVYLEPTGSNDARLSVVAGLAERLNADVIGIAAQEISQSAYFAAGERAAELIEECRQFVRQQLAELEYGFSAAMRSRARRVEFRSALDIPTDYVARHVRVADLLVVGNGEIEGLVDPLRALDLGEILIKAGRPVLLVPPELTWLDTRVVLVAWKDTRESRRAIVDALPLLRMANEVVLVEVLEEDDDRPMALGRLRDVGRWLSAHGIESRDVVPESRGDAAGQLDLLAADLGAQAVVAGAYGHTRFREWVLGGVTRHLIGQRRRCALLSH